MPRRLGFTLLCAILANATALAQSPPRFRWQAGQELDYRVEQVTTVADTADGKTETSSTKLNLTKRWQVLGVDAAGIATLQLSLLTLRMEMGKAGQEPVVFDSEKVDTESAKLNKELLQYIGKPIATLRLDAQGRLIDVKESRFGPASRFVAELPFRVTLPDSMLQRRAELPLQKRDRERTGRRRYYHGERSAGSTGRSHSAGAADADRHGCLRSCQRPHEKDRFENGGCPCRSSRRRQQVSFQQQVP